MEPNTARLIDEFKAMVEIYSPSLGEREMADVLTAKLQELGFSVWEDDAGEKLGGNCGNLYAFLPGDEALEPLLFSAHMDTVEPAKGKTAVLHEDGTITSRGDTILGADDLAGVATILEAVRRIREQNLPHRPIELFLSVAEESLCIGAGAFDFSRVKSKQAYVLDMSGLIGTACNQAPTILSFTARIEGRAAHAGFAPQEGIHAIAAASDAISKLKLGRLDENTTRNIGVIGGGIATNIIPALCTVRGEIRSYSHERALSLADETRARFLESCKAFGAALEFVSNIACVAYQTDENSPVIKRFQAAAAKLAMSGALYPSFGGSDNNVMAQNGISGIVVACGMENCHSVTEYTSVRALEDTARLTMELMLSRD